MPSRGDRLWKPKVSEVSLSFLQIVIETRARRGGFAIGSGVGRCYRSVDASRL